MEFVSGLMLGFIGGVGVMVLWIYSMGDSRPAATSTTSAASDAPMTIKLVVEDGDEGDVKILYEDQKGRITARCVNITRVNKKSIRGWCYLRQEQRMFKFKRMHAVIDLSTGECLTDGFGEYFQVTFA